MFTETELRIKRDKAYAAMKADPTNPALEDAWLKASDEYIDLSTQEHAKFKTAFNSLFED